MFRNPLSSISSLFAGTALALTLLTGCYGPKDMHVDDEWSASDKDHYSAEGSNVSQTQTKLSLYERCLLRQRGRSEAAATRYCENMMTNMESQDSYTYRPVIGTLPMRY